MAYLEIKDLSKSYGAVAALNGINLSIERGSIVALLGPNGAGKSTLFGCLLGLALPTSGQILFKGEQLTGLERSRFGHTAERVALYPQRTVAENVTFFAGLKGLPTAEAEKQIKRVGMHSVQARKVRQLSKGMLQRVGLAIALCGNPQLLILDEPFNGLDPALLDTLQTILREEQKRGATLIISTHTTSAVEPLATHVAILLRGRLAAFDTVTNLRAKHADNDSLESIYHQIARQGRVTEEVFA